MPVEKEIPTPDLEIEKAPGIDINVEQPLTNGNAMMLDDGSAIINPTEEQPSADHNSNLAELVDESDLRPMAADLMSEFESDKNSRSDWEKTYTEGLDLLGFKYDDRARPFSGASGVTHPLLAEAVTQFQAQAYKELLPAGGPVRTIVVGQATPDIRQQAERVKEFMNYQITEVMEEYDPDLDQLLFYLPLAGSAFKKVYYDGAMGRAVSKFVPAEDLIIPYYATDLDSCERITHSVKMMGNDLRKLQVSGFYRDIDIMKPKEEKSEVGQKYDELEGRVDDYQNNMTVTLLEFHVNLDIIGFEDLDVQTQEPTGIRLPYIVTIEEQSGEILSIYRNWKQGDQSHAKKQYFVHYKFLPVLGFYGFGLIHMLGGLSRTATSALRQLIDAGTLSNLPAGFKARGLRIRDDDNPLQPGEFRDVDAPGGAIRDSLMPLPYKEPSATLFQLLGFVVQAGQRFAAISDMKLAEGGAQQAPVGTTLALLERGTKVMSAIHKRCHYAQRLEFKLLSKVFLEYLPPEYPYAIAGGNRVIKVQDFDDRVDILPVSDPNIFSMAQRVTLAQTQLQLAQSNPDMHNVHEAYRRMYEALGVPDIELILPPPPPKPTPLDPAVENAYSLQGKPFQVFPEQDHEAHIRTHRAFMSSLLVKSSPPTLTVMQGHISEHVSHMARAIVDQETQEEIQSVSEQYGGQIPPELQQQFQAELEKKVAQKVAEITEQMVGEEQEMMDSASQDPLVDLKNKEIMLRKEEAEQKAQADGEKQALEEKKASDSVKISREKISSQEDIADQRAETQREKMEQMERLAKKREK